MTEFLIGRNDSTSVGLDPTDGNSRGMLAGISAGKH